MVQCIAKVQNKAGVDTFSRISTAHARPLSAPTQRRYPPSRLVSLFVGADLELFQPTGTASQESATRARASWPFMP